MSDILLSQIRKEFGDQAIFKLGDETRLDIKVRPSGSLLLDVALGGGYPQGRIIEIYGSEKAGKTTLLCLAIAEAQKNEPEKKCAIIDLEHSFNPEWAKKLGVDINELYISQPDTYAEKVYEFIEYLVKTGQFSIIGLDSVASLVPKEEFENDDWEKDSRVGGVSKLNSKAMRKLVYSGVLSNSGTTLIFINQVRDKIGGFSMYGTPTDTPGGRSLRHAYTQKLEVAVGDYFTKNSSGTKEVLGQQIKVKVTKNKIAAPYKTAVIDVYYEHGVDKIIELIKVAKLLGILVGSNWLKLVDPSTGEVVTDENGNEVKFNGEAKAREALVEDINNNEGKIYIKIYDMIQTILRG